MSIAVVTDSTADIPAAILAERGITAVPAKVQFGDVEYQDRVDLSSQEFYTRLESDKEVFPTTSAPTPEEFKGVYEDTLSQHESVISIHVSSKLSSTYESAVAGAALADPGGERIKLIDSLTCSMATGWVALAAQQVIDDGRTALDAYQEAKRLVPRVQVGGTPSTLEYLIRGGRLSGAAALLGNLLRIKPVLLVIDGQVEVAGKPRSHRQAMLKMVSLIVHDHEPVNNMAMLHTDEASRKEAESYLDISKDVVTYHGTAIVATVGPGIGAHFGPGTVGVAVSW